jgi:predicted DNA-binding transcriptional regulator YafY
VLALLELLQNGGTHTVSTLAGRLGVDERTLRRYAQHLTDLGIPIESRRGRYGGYRLMPGYKLPPLMLTDDEAVAVVLGLVAGRRAGLVTAAGAAVDSASAKVRRVLPEALGRRLDALLSSAAFTAPAWQTSPPGTAVLLVLADAARRHQPVAITYTSWRGSASERRVEPYGLVFHSGRWYVTGLDSLRGEVRTFRLDRIQHVDKRSERSDPPEDFDAVEHVSRALAHLPWRVEGEVLLHTTMEEARKRFSPSYGELEEHPDGVLMRSRTDSYESLARWLPMMRFDFTIVGPDELRDAVRDVGRRLCENADREVVANVRR